MAEISMDPTAVDTPAARLEAVGKFVKELHGDVGKQVDGASANTESAEVRDGCDIFTAGIQAALQAYSGSATQLGRSVKHAKITYKNTDDAAGRTITDENPKLPHHKIRTES